jgi:hypothetical protein
MQLPLNSFSICFPYTRLFTDYQLDNGFLPVGGKKFVHEVRNYCAILKIKIKK